ncbi:hypothetical protein HJ079_09785 [Vibrio parahaemolyticus]|nr:hypothetical protein [Vibrio parahaemolyticus]
MDNEKSVIGLVNCHTGSLEISVVWIVELGNVNCHTGSLEKQIADCCCETNVNCHTGSLERSQFHHRVEEQQLELD